MECRIGRTRSRGAGVRGRPPPGRIDCRVLRPSESRVRLDPERTIRRRALVHARSWRAPRSRSAGLAGRGRRADDLDPPIPSRHRADVLRGSPRRGRQPGGARVQRRLRTTRGPPVSVLPGILEEPPGCLAGGIPCPRCRNVREGGSADDPPDPAEGGREPHPRTPAHRRETERCERLRFRPHREVNRGFRSAPRRLPGAVAVRGEGVESSGTGDDRPRLRTRSVQ